MFKKIVCIGVFVLLLGGEAYAEPISIDVNITSAQAIELLNSIATKYGYRETINGRANPETKEQFVGKIILEFAFAVNNAVAGEAAAEAARRPAVEAARARMAGISVEDVVIGSAE